MKAFNFVKKLNNGPIYIHIRLDLVDPTDTSLRVYLLIRYFIMMGTLYKIVSEEAAPVPYTDVGILEQTTVII